MGRRRRRQPASRRQGQLPQRLRLPGCCPRRRRPSQPWRALPPSWILRCGRCPECGRCSSVSPVQLVMGPAARTPLPHITAPCLPPPPSPAGHAATGGGGAPRRQPRGGRRRPAARPALCQPAAEQAGAGGGGVGRQPDGAQAQGAAVRLRGGGAGRCWGVGTCGHCRTPSTGSGGHCRAHTVSCTCCSPSSRRQQEKGVITGSAVRYRTDDRVGAVSAAQVRGAARHPVLPGGAGAGVGAMTRVG